MYVVVENLFAGVVLVACVILLVRLLLSARGQERLDAFALAVVRLPIRSLQYYKAARAATEAIRRAKADSSQWSDKVQPISKSMRRPRKPH